MASKGVTDGPRVSSTHCSICQDPLFYSCNAFSYKTLLNEKETIANLNTNTEIMTVSFSPREKDKYNELNSLLTNPIASKIATGQTSISCDIKTPDPVPVSGQAEALELTKTG